MTILTDQQKIDAVRRVQKGESKASVARSYGVKTQTVSAIVLRRAKGPLRVKMTDQDKLNVVRRYIAGESTLSIAKTLGVTCQAIQGVLRRRGVPRRASHRYNNILTRPNPLM